MTISSIAEKCGETKFELNFKSFILKLYFGPILLFCKIDIVIFSPRRYFENMYYVLKAFGKGKWYTTGFFFLRHMYYYCTIILPYSPNISTLFYIFQLNCSPNLPLPSPLSIYSTYHPEFISVFLSPLLCL